ncbi:MAG: glycosyltransferase, partial [Desulfobacterales bacterium]|nr:glycosyltransferase [Desulfobacterales bacterium]
DKVVVCDDGSSDMTGEIAEKLGVEVLRLARNRGKGWALRKLFQTALDLNAEVVVALDGDGTHLPEQIPRLLNPILSSNPGPDLVVGSRFTDGGFGPVSRLNFVGNKLINLLIFFFTGRFLSDSQSGFRAFRRHVLENLNLESRGYEVESELTIRCIRRGCKVLEVPIRCGRTFRVSNLDSFRDGLKILCTILRAVF